MSGSGFTATDTELMSAECAVALRTEHRDLHGRCRQTKDIPVHPSMPTILVQRRCRCTCHRPTRTTTKDSR